VSGKRVRMGWIKEGEGKKREKETKV